MTTNSSTRWQPANPESLAIWFHRLGWIGFWIQVALLTIPLLLLIYIPFFSSPESIQRKGIDLSNYLSYGSLLVMLFTTFWFFRYTRLAKPIADPTLRPPRATVEKSLWIGLWAGCLGIFFSITMMVSAVGRLLFVFLTNPQTGLQIAPAPGGNPAMALSAIDAVSLTSLLFTLIAELVVLTFTLWLLFRVSRPSVE